MFNFIETIVFAFQKSLTLGGAASVHHSRRQVSKAVGVLREDLLVVGAPIGRMYRNLLDKS